PPRISVTRFADQARPAPAPAPPAAGPAHGWAADAGATRAEGRAVVVVAEGPGLAALFETEGAVVVHPGPAGSAPSTGQLLAAIRASGAGRVVVLPNDPNVIAAAN